MGATGTGRPKGWTFSESFCSAGSLSVCLCTSGRGAFHSGGTYHDLCRDRFVLWAIQDIIRVFSGGFAVLIIVPLLLRGWSGLFVALLYRLIGYFSIRFGTCFHMNGKLRNEKERPLFYTPLIFSSRLWC